MSTERAWLAWARELQGLSQTGLNYAKDPYDRERYARLGELAAEMMAGGAGATGFTDLLALFRQEVGHATPKVDVRAAAFREGQVLLVRERSDGHWTLPGGWADPGETPAENAVREVWEESGYRVRVTKLAAAYDRDRRGHPPIPYQVYKLFFLAEVVGGAPLPSLETDGIDFFAEHALPPLSATRVNEAEIRRLFAHYRQPGLPTDFD